MIGDNPAFRAQLVVPEQRQLFDYWVKCANGRSYPSRGDIKPFEFPRLLPGISLIDVKSDLARSTVRLAGTRLREIYDREITGDAIGSLDWDERRDYWLEAYKRVVNEQLPAQGVARGPRRHRDHVVQYWLKLPLGPVDGPVNMILCYDSFMAASDQHASPMAAIIA